MKVLVTGNAGSGKSTTAEILSKQLKIPYHSLDRIVWQSGWKKRPIDERKQKVQELINKKDWVIDGVDKDILKAADKVIFMDIPRSVCYRNAVIRNYKYLFRSRPGLPPNCPEILIIPRLVKIIWKFPAGTRPTIVNAKNRKKNAIFVHLKHQSAISLLLTRKEV